MQVKSLIPGFVIFLTLLLLHSTTHRGPGAKAPGDFLDSVADDSPYYDAGEEPDPELKERELQGICNLTYFCCCFFPVYDGKEHDPWGTGAKAPGDFPDSVSADSCDYYAGEEHDPLAAGSRDPRVL